MPAQAKQITIKEILEDHLGDTYPRVLAQVVNDEGKESKLTIFKSKKGIVPQVYHSYMGFFKKPKEGYHIWSYNIAWETHTEDTQDEPTEDTKEPIDEGESPPEYQCRCLVCSKLFFTDNKREVVCTECKETLPSTPPEPETFPKPGDIDIRLEVLKAEVTRQTGLTTKISLVETIKNCKTLAKYVTTGE